MKFSENLKRLMKDKGLSNYQLAKELDIHPTTVANWLDDKEPRKRTLLLLANYFGVTVDFLLGNEKAPAEEAEADDELMNMREDIRRNPDLKVLFSLGKNATPEDLRKSITIIKTICGGDDDERGNC